MRGKLCGWWQRRRGENRRLFFKAQPPPKSFANDAKHGPDGIAEVRKDHSGRDEDNDFFFGHWTTPDGSYTAALVALAMKAPRCKNAETTPFTGARCGLRALTNSYQRFNVARSCDHDRQQYHAKSPFRGVTPVLRRSRP